MGSLDSEDVLDCRLAKLGRTVASRLEEGVRLTAEEEKVCIRGLERLAIEGWGVGRWVVVRPREGCSTG